MGVTSSRRPVVRIIDGAGHESRPDSLPVEAPLTVVLDGQVLVTTMRTPGHDLELAAGWLVNESGVAHAADVTSMRALSAGSDDDVDTVQVQLAEGVRPPRPRAFVTSSACGVCSADVIAAVAAPVTALRTPGWALPADRVDQMFASMRQQQRVFEKTGSLHAAALAAPDGRLMWVREDVGRHNAVDKVVGRALLDDLLPLTDHILIVSGRVSFEIVHKALTAGVAAIVAVSGPTTLAVDLAREHDLVLAGFVRDGRINVYAGAEAVRFEEAS